MDISLFMIIIKNENENFYNNSNLVWSYLHTDMVQI